MKNSLTRLVTTFSLSALSIGCVSFPSPNDPSSRYETHPQAPQYYERIHDNMDVSAYNQGVGALVRGEKDKLNQSLLQLDTAGGQFNRASSGNLRALSTCGPAAPQSPKSPLQCPRP